MEVMASLLLFLSFGSDRDEIYWFFLSPPPTTEIYATVNCTIGRVPVSLYDFSHMEWDGILGAKGGKGGRRKSDPPLPSPLALAF